MADIIEELRALAFVRPREKCIPEAADEIERLREENARLREAVKNAYYEGWQDRESVVATEDGLHSDWMRSEARAAIREGGKDE